MGAQQDIACPNCGAVLTGAYCATCGQKRVQDDLTLREFLHETTHEMTHWDGKVPNTLKALFFKPGLLTLDFLGGRRARWIPPLRLYLICSVAFFLSGPLVEGITHRSVRQVAKFSLSNDDGSTTLTPESRKEIEQGLPARVLGTDRLIRAAENNVQLNRAINSAFPKAMFVLLPLFAFLTYIAWKRKLQRYPAHLYVALHLHAVWFGALAIATVATIFVRSDSVARLFALAAAVYVFWYVLVALHRVFGDSWVRTIAKGAAVGIVYAACFLVTSLALLAYAIASM
jgi:hypothetical protein